MTLNMQKTVIHGLFMGFSLDGNWLEISGPAMWHAEGVVLVVSPSDQLIIRHDRDTLFGASSAAGTTTKLGVGAMGPGEVVVVFAEEPWESQP